MLSVLGCDIFFPLVILPACQSAEGECFLLPGTFNPGHIFLPLFLLRCFYNSFQDFCGLLALSKLLFVFFFLSPVLAWGQYSPFLYGRSHCTVVYAFLLSESISSHQPGSCIIYLLFSQIFTLLYSRKVLFPYLQMRHLSGFNIVL